MGALGAAVAIAAAGLVAQATPHPVPPAAGWGPVQAAAIVIDPEVLRSVPAAMDGGWDEPKLAHGLTTNNDRVVLVGPFAAIPQPDSSSMSPIDAYLCEVYRRTPTKKDSSGDFTWKDPAAAKRRGMDTCRYVIGGMNPEFKLSLMAFGQAADKRGIKWSMLSAFRDDYRQSIAVGVKARTGNSLHGGSRVTKGYGDGRAVDIAVAEGSIKALLKMVDGVGRTLGLSRPYPGFDPQHVQMAGGKTKVDKKAKVTKVAKKHKVKKTRYAKRYKKHRRRAA